MTHLQTLTNRRDDILRQVTWLIVADAYLPADSEQFVSHSTHTCYGPEIFI